MSSTMPHDEEKSDVLGMLEEVRDMTDAYASTMTNVAAPELGLDSRCGYVLVNDECIAVSRLQDATLQYYGGFEYVDDDWRVTLGDYVFYLANDDRVKGHIERWKQK